MLIISIKGDKWGGGVCVILAILASPALVKECKRIVIFRHPCAFIKGIKTKTQNSLS